ncbi:MAG: hypothetical protein HPY57_15510 [Ignavibacteria bacterium]|nr:hypothetical protein [Ignavibacteria bacterium]
MSKNGATKSGISTSMLLFFIFLVLKLTNTIDWSWWWVTCPLWAGFALIGAVIVIIFVISIIVTLFKILNNQ